MVPFTINLIKEHTAPPQQRKRMFVGMVIYLVACGVILVGMAYHATQRLVRAAALQAETVRLEARFERQHPGEKDIVAYARGLKAALDDHAVKLESVRATRGKRVDLARVLLALSAPLPGDVNIVSFEFNEDQGALEFELVVPVGGGGEAMDASQLVGIWNGDPALMSRVGKISSSRSQRQRLEGTAVYVMHFACTVLKKDT